MEAFVSSVSGLSVPRGSQYLLVLEDYIRPLKALLSKKFGILNKVSPEGT